jgi:hypothetical protein
MNTDALFTTKEMHLFCTLYALGHELSPNGISKDGDRTIWFSFKARDVRDDVKAYREGRNLKVNLQRFLWAYTLFRCVLHGEQRDMFTVWALRSMGNEVVDGGIWRDNGMIFYEFEDGANNDRDRFWGGEEIKVDHTAIIGSMNWFRSNIHSV